jgi:uncharacterized protein (TIGR02246 family)
MRRTFGRIRSDLWRHDEEEPLGPDRVAATAFVESYRQAWESWDAEHFVALFTEKVRYVAHPQEAIEGREALRRYFRKEKAEQGRVSVRMGRPIVEGDHLAAEFWVTATNRGEEATIAGCLIAQLDGPDGGCTQFREYWFDIEGHSAAFEGWGG